VHSDALSSGWQLSALLPAGLRLRRRRFFFSSGFRQQHLGAAFAIGVEEVGPPLGQFGFGTSPDSARSSRKS
jgi:hypothetical protein